MTSAKSGLTRVAAFVTAFALFLTVFLIYPQSAAVLAEDGGYPQSGEGYSINVKAVSILINGRTLDANTTVKDGDTLSFDFNWTMAHRPTADTIEFDLSALLHGVSLTPTTLYDRDESGNLKATYTINGNKLTMKMKLDEFEQNDLWGKVSMNGKIDLNDVNDIVNGKFKLKIFDVLADVTASDYVATSGVSKKAGKVYYSNGAYYIDYVVTAKNTSPNAAKATLTNVTVTDKPDASVSSIIVTSPSNQSCTKDENGNYVFKLNDIAPGGSVDIRYTAKLDMAALAKGYGSVGNNVVLSSDEAADSTSGSWVSYARPSISKTGSADKKTGKVTWTVTVDPGFLIDKVNNRSLSYTVSDELGSDSGTFTDDGSKINNRILTVDSPEWTGEKFVFTVVSDIPDDKMDSSQNESVSNKVTATPSISELPDMVITETVYFLAEYGVGVNKTCLGKTEATDSENGYVTWKVDVTVPQTDYTIKKIMIDDKLNGSIENMESESKSMESLELIDADGVTYDLEYIRSLGSVNSHYGINIVINNQDFINQHKGKSFTLKYKTKITNETTFAVTNNVSAEVSIDKVTSKKSTSSASFTNVVEQPMLSKSTEPFYNYDADAKNPLGWKLTVVSPTKDLKDSDVITITDTLPEGYKLSDWETGKNIKVTRQYNEWGNMSEDSDAANCVSFSQNAGKLTFTVKVDQYLANYLNSEVWAKLNIIYGTVMTDDGYEAFEDEALKSGESNYYAKTVTNSAEGNINGGKKYGPVSSSQEIKYTFKDLVSKTATTTDEPDGRYATYTVVINENGEKILDDGAQTETVTVRDEFGTNLTLVEEPTITPAPEGSVNINSDEHYFEMTLKDKTKYTITYKMRVATINKDMNFSSDKIDQKFGNSIRIMLDGEHSYGKRVTLAKDQYESTASSGSTESEKSITVSGEKLWQSDGNEVRPKQIFVDISKIRVVNGVEDTDNDYDDNVYHDTRSVTSSSVGENWSFTIDGLKTIENVTDPETGYSVSKHYNYYITEIKVDGYSATYSVNVDKPINEYAVNGNVDLAITNTFDAPNKEVGNVVITKSWKNEPSNVTRPETISLVLTDENNNTYSSTVNGDEYTFSNLPLFKYERKNVGGTEKLVRTPMTYTLSETGADKYILSVNGNRDCKFTLTTGTFYDADSVDSLIGTTVNVSAENTYDGTSVSVTAEKRWSADTPDTKKHFVYFNLMRSSDNINYDYVVSEGADKGKTTSNEAESRILLNAGNGWKATIDGLPQSDSSNNAYTYKVEENFAASGINEYQAGGMPGYTSNRIDLMTIENTWHNVTVTIPIKKVWDDSNADHTNDTVYVDLRRKVGDVVDATFKQQIELNNANQFSETVDDLDKYDAANNEYVYYIENESGNVTFYDDTAGRSGYVASYGRDADGTLTVTNTWKTYDSGKTEVAVEKVWDDGNADHTNDTVYVDLRRKVGDVVDATFKQQIELNSTNQFSETVDNLNKYDADNKEYEYYIENESGNVTFYDDTAGRSGYVASYGRSPDGKTLTVTNTWKTYDSGKTEVAVKKVWNDIGDHTGDTVYVDLRRKGGNDVVDDSFTKQIVLNSTNQFRETVDNLDKYDAANNEYEYYIENESGVTFYDDTAGISGYEAAYGRDADGTLTVTNTWKEYTPDNPITPSKIHVTVSKIWDDSSRTDIFSHDSDVVTVTLMRSAGGVTEPVQNIVLTAAGNFSADIYDLDEFDAGGNAYTYYITDEKCIGAKMYDGVSGYIAYYDGTTVKNIWKEESQQPETAFTAITVVKRWADNTAGISHGAVNVVLRKLGTTAVIDTASLNELNGWTYTFSDLPVYDADGSRIVYEVVEATAFSGYTVSYPDGNTVYAEEGLTGRVTILNTQDSSEEPEPIPPMPWFPPFNPYIPEGSDDISSGAGILEESEREDNFALAAVGAVSALAAVTATVIAALKKKKRKSK